MKTYPFCALLFLLAGSIAAQDELEISADEFPRVPPTEPADALATFEIAPGFELSLAAHEPDVADPIAMAFDEKGRAWVLEMRGYSERRDEELGRVRLLTDTDGDGVFDESVIFKDGLKWPNAIACYKGGVFVGATPDITYFRDTDGDDVADEERVVFTGFGAGKELRLNMQSLFNSFRWGPDNRIWGATAGTGGIVEKPDDPSFGPVTLRGADFSFDPEKLDLRPENGTAQYGMSFDSRGRRFVCSNSRHLIWVAWERHHLNPNPWYTPPAALVNIPDDGAAAPVYRISPDEPWRIVRTRWRVAGVVKGMVEGGGRVSGYFTSATGVHLYWGNAFGEEYRDNAFVGDVGSNLVHRKIVRSRPGSTELVGSRPDPEEKTEFLRSRDNWFRPTSFATGPDGCLYVTDMYRETIEHPWSLPEPIKKHLDLNAGFQRGRIYRVAPEGFGQPEIPDLGALDVAGLKQRLESDNDWEQTTARRLLYERGEPIAAPVPGPFPALLAAKEPLLDRIGETADDPWMRAAVLNSLRTPESLRQAWTRAAELGNTAFAADLVTMIGRSGDAEAIAFVADALSAEPLSLALVSRIEGLGKGARNQLAGHDRWNPLLEAARETLTSGKGDLRAAIRLLTFLGGSAGQEQLENVLAKNPDPALATDLVGAIRNLPILVDTFPSLPDATRSELGNRILGNADAAKLLLDKIADESLALADTPAALIEGLRQHRDESVRKRAAEVLPPVVSRADVIAKYRESLTLAGDYDRGKAAFAKACLTCHVSHEGEGITLGPEIATFATAGKESLLERILDPNREVAPQYQAYIFELVDGSALTGVIHEESPEQTTLRLPGGIDRTFPRTEVKSMKGLGQSLMPEGLEAALTMQEMADLLEYLTTTRP